MPVSPPSICTAPGCGTLVYGGGRCPDCMAQTRRERDKTRGNGTQRGWSTKWAAFSKAYLIEHPLCECDECAQLPPWQRPASTDVDHIDGTGRTGARAYDKSNLMALSHAHHARKTAREDGGFGRTKG